MTNQDKERYNKKLKRLQYKKRQLAKDIQSLVDRGGVIKYTDIINIQNKHGL